MKKFVLSLSLFSLLFASISTVQVNAEVSEKATVGLGALGTVVAAGLGIYLHGKANQYNDQLEVLKSFRKYIANKNRFHGPDSNLSIEELSADEKVQHFMLQLERLGLLNSFKNVFVIQELDGKISGLINKWVFSRAFEMMCFGGAITGAAFAGHVVKNKFSQMNSDLSQNGSQSQDIGRNQQKDNRTKQDSKNQDKTKTQQLTDDKKQNTEGKGIDNKVIVEENTNQGNQGGCKEEVKRETLYKRTVVKKK